MSPFFLLTITTTTVTFRAQWAAQSNQQIGMTPPQPVSK